MAVGKAGRNSVLAKVIVPLEYDFHTHDWRKMMSIRHRLSFLLPFGSLVVLVTLLFTACGGTTSTGGSGAGTAGDSLTKISIALGYIPDISHEKNKKLAKGSEEHSLGEQLVVEMDSPLRRHELAFRLLR